MHDTDLGSMLNILSTGTHRKPLPSLIKKKKTYYSGIIIISLANLQLAYLLIHLKGILCFPQQSSNYDSIRLSFLRTLNLLQKTKIGKTMQQLESSAHLSATQRQQHQRQQNQQQRECCAPGKN